MSIRLRTCVSCAYRTSMCTQLHMHQAAPTHPKLPPQSETWCSAPLPAGVTNISHISFHPYDADRLATTAAGATHIWRIERLWDRLSFKPFPVALDKGGAHPPTIHCWFPLGLYVGTASGRVYAVDPSDGKPLTGPVPEGELEEHRRLESQPKEEPAAAGRAQSPSSFLHLAQALAPGGSRQRAREGGAGTPEPEHGDSHTHVQTPPGDRMRGPGVSFPPPIVLGPLYADVMGTGHTPVTSLAVNRDLVAVGGTEGVAWLTHARGSGEDGVRPQLFMRFETGPAGSVTGLCYGGSQHTSVVAGVADGRVLILDPPAAPPPPLPASLRASLADDSRPSSRQHHSAGDGEGEGPSPLQHTPYQHSLEEMQALAASASRRVGSRVLVDGHVGAVAALVPHPVGGPAAVSAGADGTLRVWDASPESGGGAAVARRAFAAGLMCLAASPVGLPLVAVGSETGVLRLVVLPSTNDGASDRGATPEGGIDSRASVTPPTGGSRASRDFRVSWRRRLHKGALRSAAFSPDGWMLATAGADGLVWFLSIGRDARGTVIGHVAVPEAVTCVVWPKVHDTEECVMVRRCARVCACVRLFGGIIVMCWCYAWSLACC